MLAIVAFGVPLAINLSARVNAEVRTQARAQVDLVAATAADLLGSIGFRPEGPRHGVPRLAPDRGLMIQQELAAASALPAGGPPGHTNAPAARQPIPAPVSNRAPSTTIDALEREFHKKKQRELEQARSVSTATADSNGAAPRRTGEKVGRNDPCPCGSGKKYKKCHGADA